MSVIGTVTTIVIGTITNKQYSMEKIKIEHHTVSGGLWFAAWIFTIGYLQLSFWQGVLAIIIWPYYIGAHFSPLLG